MRRERKCWENNERLSYVWRFFILLFTRNTPETGLSSCSSSAITVAIDDCVWVDSASVRWCLRPKWPHHRQVAPRMIFVFHFVFWRDWTRTVVVLTWHARSGPLRQSNWLMWLTSRGRLPGWLMNLNCIDYWGLKTKTGPVTTNDRKR